MAKTKSLSEYTSPLCVMNIIINSSKNRRLSHTSLRKFTFFLRKRDKILSYKLNEQISHTLTHLILINKSLKFLDLPSFGRYPFHTLKYVKQCSLHFSNRRFFLTAQYSSIIYRLNSLTVLTYTV